MARLAADLAPARLPLRQAGMGLRAGIGPDCRRLAFRLAVLTMLVWADSSRAVLLWSDLGATQVHETGAGVDILGGGLKRDATSTETL